MTVRKALQYAEEQLGIHKIYVETMEIQAFMDDQYRTRAGLESESRKLVIEMERRKMEIVTDLLSQFDESIAAHDRRVRIAVANDEKYQRLVDRSCDVMAHRDNISAAISGHENNHRAHVARMKLLGGFLEFCGAVKQDETIAVMEKYENPF